jgi:DNA-directed RNA polymerase subunit L|tara:strand:- start:241 stop:1347 length:1107 start_codon:yes stop_codon:yes gene_type:complete
MSTIVIDTVTEMENHLEFDLKNVDLSVVNGLRRIILTKIPSLVIRGFPHEQNLIQIETNTTKYNNEYLKHRLSCIPILISNQNNFNKIIKDFVLKVHIKNDTTEKITLTTKHIKIYNKDGKVVNYKDGKYTKSIFVDPPIPICYLYPRITESEPFEEFTATIKLSIGTAKEDACWNMVSKCLFFNIEDTDKNEKILENIPEEKHIDFKLLDAQRQYLPNQYTFVLETIGVYNNKVIVEMACLHIIETFKEFTEHLTQITIKSYVPNIPVEGPIHIYKKKIVENDIMYIIKLEEDDYTYGKLIEKYIYNHYQGLLKFIAFKKEHPHDKHSLVQIVYIEQNTDSDHKLKQLLMDIFKVIQIDFQHIKLDS